MLKTFKIFVFLVLLISLASFSYASDIDFEKRIKVGVIFAQGSPNTLAKSLILYPFLDVSTILIGDGFIGSIDDLDCIVFDLLDSHGDYISQTVITNELQPKFEKFLENGGSILFTHDTIDNSCDWGSKIEKFVGLTKNFANPFFYSSLVTIKENNHPIFSSFFNIDFPATSSLTVGDTHSTWGELLQGNDAPALLITFNDNYNPNEYFLIAKETITSKNKKARTAYIASGHTSDITLVEEKLIVNIVVWFSKKHNIN